MRPDILDAIKQLTAADPKSLSAKTLKLFEEGGELAKSVLPYEGAAGTLHRIVHKGKLLEEVADVMLVALSIAYELGFDDDAISSAMLKKSLYWAELQKNEAGINPDKIPHEIHVTVESAVDIESFRDACKSIGVKPVVLALHTQPGAIIRDVMTSQVVIGTTTDAFHAMEATGAGLAAQGYRVVRSKIEAAPWHPSAPTLANGLQHSEHNYFESHIEVYVNEDSDINLNRLMYCLAQQDAHVSGNFFKSTDTHKTVMVTLRRYTGTLEDFKSALERLKNLLRICNFEYNKKDIVEYSIYDSKVMHDDEWIHG